MAAVDPGVCLLYSGEDESGDKLGLGLLISLNPESWLTVEDLSCRLAVKFLEPFHICCWID